MKRFFIPLIVLCVLVAGLAAAVLLRSRSAEAAMRETDAALRSTVSALTEERDALRAETGELQAALDDARAAEAALEAEQAALDEKVRALSEETETLTAELDARKLPDAIRAHRRFTEHTLDTPHAKAFRYYLYEPGVPSDEPLPLVLFLHGSGGSFDIHDGATLPTMLDRGWLAPNALVLMPQCPGPSWDTYCEDLMLLLETVAEEYGADRSRISVTGFSLGGVGTFSMLVSYPDYFSAALPLAAKCFPDKCAVITSTPVRILHGEKDSVMDPTSVKAAVEVINDAGGECTLTMFPGEDHLIQQHYLDEGGEPIEWLISQRRPDGISARQRS